MMPAEPLSYRREFGHLLRSVVKVLCVSDAADYDQPWQSHGPSSCTGSGTIIETTNGPRVLTNAHCVADHVFIEVRRYGKSQKFEAEVEALGHECDLALLRIDDEDFFAGTVPMRVGSLPRLGQRVSALGYPVGGERLSITEGIVSRIELVSYAQTNRELLAVQIDAAINSGNSGGPVVKGGELVGVAFQALDDAEGVGYMIAPPVVRHFLADVGSGSYEGFPALGATTQRLQSPAQRRSLGLPERSKGGVLIKRVCFGGSAHGVLNAGDVLLAVDGAPIASDGTVELSDGVLVKFRQKISEHFVGERLPVTVWRAGQQIICVIELKPPPFLVAEDRYDARPSYFVYGGMLFVPLTRDYLKTWGETWWQSAPHELVAFYENELRTQDRQEVVVLQKVLADRVNRGYHDLDNLVIESVDGTRVQSLAHMVELVEAPTSESYITFVGSDGTTVVFNRSQVRKRSRKMLAKFGVPSDRSEDLLTRA